jgi:hypothetical protein
MANGINPHDKWTSITCWLHADAGTSVTGQKQIKQFGRGSYNFNLDKII